MVDESFSPHMGGKLISSQVTQFLMKELRSGIFAEADRLPSEVELSERLGVSRTVIRDALSDIEREGFIERTRGIGTLINREIVGLSNRLDLKQEYNELIRNAGCRPRIGEISLRTEYAGDALAQKLGIKPGTAVLVCEKTVCAEASPVIFSVDYLPIPLFSHVERNNIDWSRPIFDILEKYCGILVTSCITKVSATNADTSVRKKLALSPQDALILLDEVSYAKSSRPILCTLAYFTGFFDFYMLRKKF